MQSFHSASITSSQQNKVDTISYRKKIFVFIGILSIIKLFLAFWLELGNDEAYYWFYSQYLQWNYFDHPPAVGWLIRLSTFNLLLDNEFFTRLGAIVSAAITTWILFLSGKKLMNEYTGFLASLIYTATLYGTIVAGTFILPDSPQLVFWSFALYLLIQITDNTTIDNRKRKQVFWFGAVAGLAMLCKIHAIFLWSGFLLYILFYNRKWLKQPVLYLSGIVTLLIFFPVIKWNIDNHFITYLYHSERVNVSGASFDIDSFLSFAGGQIFYFNPVIFIFIVIATVAALKNKFRINPYQKSILLFCSLPLIIIAFIISLFRNVLPHWTGPAYISLILLTALYFNKRHTEAVKPNKPTPLLLKMALGLSLFIITAGILLINFYPGTFGKKDSLLLGEGDFTLDMYGWKNLKPAVEKIIQRNEQTGLMKKDAVIISNKWFPASHIDYYIALPLKKDLIAIGDTTDIHQYAWINKQRKKLSPGDDAYCIVPSENYMDVHTSFNHLFSSIPAADTILQKRSGKVCRQLYVYRLKNYTGASSLSLHVPY